MILSTLLSIGYCVGRSQTSSKKPYGLTNNYRQFQLVSNEKINFQDIINVDRDTCITLISEYPSKNYIALYDPSYYYYRQKMVDYIGITRYFSYSDYQNKTNTGILVSDNSNIFAGYSALVNHNTPLLDELIFSINPLSVLYQPNIDYIINQASIKHLGNTVYIDSKDLQAVHDIEDRLISAGYQIVNNTHPNLLGICKFIVSNGLYEKIILIPALSLYIIFLYTCFMFFTNNKQVLKIHILHGGNTMYTFFTLSKTFLIINLLF